MSREKGIRAEDQACAYIESLGMRVLARNYRVRGAELDIVAQEGDVIAFVEVKGRSSLRYAAPRESVTPAKQRRIAMAALYWLQENDMPDATARFDIVEILPCGATLLRGAFFYSQS